MKTKVNPYLGITHLLSFDSFQLSHFIYPQKASNEPQSL
jgi:hypothetical protein